MIVDEKYATYVSTCKNKVDSFFLDRPHMLQYLIYRNRRKGVVIAWQTPQGKIRLGWSLCHRRDRHKYNNFVGISEAIKKAFFSHDEDAISRAPRIIRPLLKKMQLRASKRWKTEVETQ